MGDDRNPGASRITFDLAASSTAWALKVRTEFYFFLVAAIALSIIEVWAILGAVGGSLTNAVIAVALTPPLALSAVAAYGRWLPAYTDLVLDETGIHFTHSDHRRRDRDLSWSSERFCLRIQDGRDLSSTDPNWPLFAVRATLATWGAGSTDLIMPAPVCDELLSNLVARGLKVRLTRDDDLSGRHLIWRTITAS